MTTNVIYTIGATSSPITPDFTDLQSWENNCATDLTTSRSNTTASGSTSSTIVLDAGASGTDNFYNGHPVWIDARSSEKRMITAYNGTTKTATIGAFEGSSATWDNIPTVEAYTIDSIVYIGKCLDQGQFTAALTISGQTVDSTHNIILQCATGASFKDKVNVRTTPLRFNTSNGVAINRTGNSYDSGVTVLTDYTEFNGLQIHSDGWGIRFDSTGNNIRIDSCIVESQRSVIGAAGSGSGGGPVTVLNSLIISQGSNKPGFEIWNAGHSIIGCTLIGNGGIGIDNNFGTQLTTVKDCAVFGFTTFSGSIDGANVSYNATDVSSAVGSNNLTSLVFADQFENSTNDFRAISTGDLHAGTPDSTNIPDDITGTTRDSTTIWIGAWEVSGGSLIRSVIGLLFGSKMGNAGLLSSGKML